MTDGFVMGELSGWAFREGRPSVSAQLHHGDTLLLVTAADRPREDLQQVFGVMNCGFRFTLTDIASAMRGREEDARAPLRVVVEGVELAGATAPCNAADLADMEVFVWLSRQPTSATVAHV